MKLIVFLGNPGLKYRKTRHNIGFMVGGFLAKQWQAKWKLEKKFSSEIARQENTILAKPQLFYNLTGESVVSIMNFYKIAKSDILVVCDDFNIDFGTLRYRSHGSDGGNNGLKSIISHIGEDFARLRIGTGNEKRKVMNDADFVLSKFNRDEQSQLPEIITKTIEKINEEFLK